MRRTVWLVALVVASLAATSASAAPPTRAEFNALKSKVKKLETLASSLRARLDAVEACSEEVVPVARYGGLANEGYVYAYEAQQTIVYATALDYVDDDTELTPGEDFLWFQIIDPSCVEDAVGRASLGAPKLRAHLYSLPR